MSKYLLQIDTSESKDKSEDDLIKIKLSDENFLQFNFTKLFIQSKYIQDKYKYSEALESIQTEIEEVESKFHIDDETIKNFIQLIQEEKVSIPIEHYKDFYSLSEFFGITKFTSILDKIGRKELFKDLNFTIQILVDSEKVNNSFEMKLVSQIENFLIERINECIENEKFRELPVPTIFRILDQSKGKFNHNLLVDFIFESIDTRFILLKFVELQKLDDEKVDEFIQFIDEQDETTKKMCLDYMSFNLSFIKNIQNKYNQLLNKMDQTKQELNETKEELNQIKQELNPTKQEFNQTKEKFNQTKQELNKSKEEFNQTKEELDREKQELEQTKQELNNKNQELNQTKQELDQINHEFNKTKQELNQANTKYEQAKNELVQYKRELKLAKDEFNLIINENKCTQSITVCGYDRDYRFGKEPNNKNKSDCPIIFPPLKLSFDSSSVLLLSYSIICYHSVLVTSNGSLKGAGDNQNGRISGTLQKSIIKDFTDFSIKDKNGHQLAAVSAVCSQYGTLYMFLKNNGNGRHLVLCDSQINGGEPVFLDIGNHQPVSLFGGFFHSAAICSEGEVIFINRNSVKNSPNSPIEAVSLPEGQKASSVACCNDSVVVLSSNGRVFESPIVSNRVLKFSEVSELSGIEIVCVSGVFNHFLAVSKEGRVFARGSNQNGKLGIGKEKVSVSSFTEILSLRGFEIRSAYAGCNHSLFETKEGKILSCGFNQYGELLLSSGPSENVYSPTETSITSGASFCIAGGCTSAVFIGNSPPPNTPNMRIQQF